MAGLTRAEHRVDVGGGSSTVVTVIAAPETVGSAGQPPIVVFTFPGAGYGRRYFDLELGDRVGADAGSYSQAEHHAQLGIVVVACDRLGCGESDGAASPPLDRIAAANAATVAEMQRRIASGEAAPGLPPLNAAGSGSGSGSRWAAASRSWSRAGTVPSTRW